MKKMKPGFRGTNIFDSEEMMAKAFPEKSKRIGPTPLLFSLERVDMRYAGGPMGSETTPTDWIKYFTTVEFAKEFAWEDFSKGRSLAKPFQWHNEKLPKLHSCHSEDLGFCMYYIEPVNVER